MKFNKIISLVIVSSMLVFSACDSIVDEEYLENNTDVAGVELSATQSTPGGNKITLDLVTPGVNGYWDYNLGKALTDKITIIYPIPGKATFTFTGTLGAEFFSKTIDVQIDQLDNALDQDWYDLVSEDTAGGKTWVFNGGPSPDGRLWWFMSAPDGRDSAWSLWWNAAGDCCPPADAAGKMKFDLNGAANFTYYSNASGAGQLGSFVLDVANKKLQINDSNILGAAIGDGGDNPSGLFDIISLTEDELVLYTANAAWATGWTYVFKPE